MIRVTDYAFSKIPGHTVAFPANPAHSRHFASLIEIVLVYKRGWRQRAVQTAIDFPFHAFLDKAWIALCLSITAPAFSSHAARRNAARRLITSSLSLRRRE